MQMLLMRMVMKYQVMSNLHNSRLTLKLKEMKHQHRFKFMILES